MGATRAMHGETAVPKSLVCTTLCPVAMLQVQLPAQVWLPRDSPFHMSVQKLGTELSTMPACPAHVSMQLSVISSAVGICKAGAQFRRCCCRSADSCSQ